MMAAGLLSSAHVRLDWLATGGCSNVLLAESEIEYALASFAMDSRCNLHVMTTWIDRHICVVVSASSQPKDVECESPEK
jgi:hypothetical protein